VLCPWTNNMTQNHVETCRAIKLQFFCFLFLLRLAKRIFNFIRELYIFCSDCHFHVIRINQWRIRFQAAVRRYLLEYSNNYVLSTRQSRTNRWLYLLIQSLSRIVKYQFDVSRVINPRDRHIEGWIRNRYTLWTKLSRASHIRYATSISKLHSHPSGIIASISHIILTIQRKRFHYKSESRNLPKKLLIIKRTSITRP